MVVAAPAAYLAQHINVRQKIHLDAPLPFPLAGLATTAGNIERKPSRLVTALACLRQHGVEVAHLREHPGIGRGIRARRTPDRRLIDANHFVDVLRSRNRLVLARPFARPIELPRQRAIKNVIHQSRFARAGNAGHHGHHAQGKNHIQILEIIFFGAQNRQRRAIGVPPLRPHRNRRPP